MGILDRKLLRDLWRLKAQVLAIALVMAAGVATLVLGIGTSRSLEETQAAYYERQRFADIFAQVRRAPERLGEEIAEIAGVAAVETRIVETAILDIEGMVEPASAQLVSLPDAGEPVLNALYLRMGRTPDPAHTEEVVINEGFARAHRFTLGSHFNAIVNGRLRQLQVVGVALSPEFIYTIAPGSLFPDDRRYAILWMSRRALAAAFDLEGAFSALSVRLLVGASEQDTIERIDAMLDRYGGRGAHGRADQQSHAFLDAELQQLRAMSAVLPPIFLFVAAFLVNMTLSRLVALEREQIGLMKALGYGSAGVAWHYLKFVAAISLVGVVIGAFVGTWLGRELAALYGRFYSFPYLIFRIDAGVYFIAAAVTLLAALAGAVRAVWSVAGLSPAVAMQPAAPTRYRRLLGGVWLDWLPQSGRMIARHIARWPARAAFTLLGIALSVAVLIGADFAEDSIEHMVDAIFFQSDRQDATITFVSERPVSAASDIARLPGVMTAEPMRALAARITNGPVSRRVAIQGRPPDADLSRVIDGEGRPVRLPETGVVLTDKFARILRARVGDLVQVETLERRRRIIDVPVTGVVQNYLGLAGYMDVAAANRLNLEGAVISGVNVMLDAGSHDELYREIKAMPAVASISLQTRALETLRRTMAENILLLTGVFTMLALVIAFGVVYNSARIQLSERGRELASLRVLGFTRGEVSWILLSELAILTAFALPVGWLLGYGFAYAIAQGVETELFSFPLVIERTTYALASVIVIAAAVGSALVVRRRIDRLDLVEVLKTRE
jgi:putative ABC transport system permease protein